MIEVRGIAVPDQLWSVIEYSIKIDDTDRFSNRQITGTDTFQWQFAHNGRHAEARFQPIGWQVDRWWKLGGRQQFRLCIDGVEIARDTVEVEGLAYYNIYYLSLLLFVFGGIPLMVFFVVALFVG